MILVPTWALLVLVAANIIFAVLAFRQDRLASRISDERDEAVKRIGGARLQGRNDGLIDGYKRGWGEAYTAARKAQRRGADPVDAIMQRGALNAPALAERNGETVEL